MKRIAARGTYALKRVATICWLGLPALVVLLVVLSAPRIPPVGPVALLLVLAAFAYKLLQTHVWTLVDDVADCGDQLIVTNRGVKVAIPLADILNVSVTVMGNSSRITLRLARPTSLGSEISFLPRTSFPPNPFVPNPIGEDLIIRVDQAKAARRRGRT